MGNVLEVPTSVSRPSSRTALYGRGFLVRRVQEEEMSKPTDDGIILLRRVWLFLRIVWREIDCQPDAPRNERRMNIALAWEIAGLIHPLTAGPTS